MTTAEDVAAEIRGLTVHLVDVAITQDHHWPKARRHRSTSTVSFDNDLYVADAMNTLPVHGFPIAELLRRRRASLRKPPAKEQVSVRPVYPCRRTADRTRGCSGVAGGHARWL